MAAKTVHQFKITLKDIEPVIWRRIQVPSKYSFWDLHVAIQDSMGWMDCHLHMFRMKRKHGHKITMIGIPMEEDDEMLPGWDINIDMYLFEPGQKAEYEYDFGDCWEHEVLFEGILIKEKGRKYPVCLDGERACPPEDCGGTIGYSNLLEILEDPKHEDHDRMKEWLSGWYDGFDPEKFDKDSVKFDNPKTRWRRAFSGGI